MIELSRILNLILHDKPNIYVEELLSIVNNNQHTIGGLLITELESILHDRKKFKDFTDDLIDSAKRTK